MAPFELKHIDRIVLCVRDLARSLAFYGDVLGCTVENYQREIGLMQVLAGTSLIDLVPVDGPLGRKGGSGPGTEGHNVDHFALEIDPFDAQTIGAHLCRHGVAIGEVGTRYGARGDGPSIYINDPDGKTIELKGPRGG
ncbi:MAG: VOC family protein [Alphaproteobacteria bacterium]|nr:VOC family protein [Alphaproteobacteria bacterium]